MRLVGSPNATRVELCGRLSVELAGHRVERELPGRQGRLVFAYMAMNRDRPVERDELLDLLWPRTPPADPRETLAALIAKLRRALGEGVLDGRRDLTLRLPADTWIDLEAAEASLGAAEAARERGDWPLVWKRAHAASELLAGELLAGDESEWLEGARNEAEELRLRALEGIAAAGLGLGGSGIGGAERAARALIAAAPYRESGHRLLIESLAAGGNVAEGLRAYDELRVRLRDELGTAPGAAMRELHRELLAASEDGGAEPGAAVPPRQERKLVTVLVAAPRGDADPEGERFAAAVASFGGTARAESGPLLIATFGAPVANEDDAERAVRAALGMRETVTRAALASGEALISPDDPGGAPAAEPGTAARELLGSAAADAVLVDELTFQLTRHAVEYGEPDPEGPAGWQAHGTAVSRAAPSPFVGRGHELSLLESFQRSTVEDERPRLVVILGDAGIGKTRLAEELIESVGGGQGDAALRGRCLAYGEGIAYWPLREILWEAAGIQLADSGEVAVEKLGSLTDRLFGRDSLDGGDQDRTRFALALTAGIAIEANPLEEMAPETVAEEVGIAWPRFLSALAVDGPATVLVEDLHWAEPALLEMLERIAARSNGPLLVLATARPQFAEANAGWAAGQAISQVSLAPLNEDRAMELLSGLLPAAEPELRARIAAAAEGNPFFLEEIVRHVTERGPSDTGEIPGTIRALLAARIDSLEEAEKHAVQDAAVVGRRFWRPALEAIHEGPPLGDTLGALERKGLIVTSSGSAMPGQTELAFRHALSREVAYLSIPGDRRCRAHAAAGEWLETVLGDRREEFIELVAHHHEAAADPAEADAAWDDQAERDRVRRKAFASLLEAGDSAQTRSDTGTAIGFAQRALRLAEGDEGRLRALDAIARAHHAAVHGDEALAAYVEAIELATSTGDAAALAGLRARMALLCSRYAGALTAEGWERRAVENVEAGLDELGDDGETFEVGALLVGRSCIPRWLGTASASEAGLRADVERAIDIAEAIGSSNLLAHGLEGLSQFNLQTGFCEAGAIAGRLVAAGKRLGDPLEAHESRVDATLLYVRAGEFDRAAATGREVSRQAANLTAHRRLHAAGAQTACLVPTGDFARLLEETEGVPELVEAEGGRTCPYGGLALAGHALALHEAARERAAADSAAQLSEAAAPRGRGPALRYMAVEILRPVIGLDGVRAQVERIEASPSLITAIYRLRVDLQLAALAGDWAAVEELGRDARARARTACAPALGWIAAWAEAMRSASDGRPGEAARAANEASDALERYGERYTASRLLVDLAPLLDGDARSAIATRALERLRAMDALASAAEAEACV